MALVAMSVVHATAKARCFVPAASAVVLYMCPVVNKQTDAHETNTHNSCLRLQHLRSDSVA